MLYHALKGKSMTPYSLGMVAQSEFPPKSTTCKSRGWGGCYFTAKNKKHPQQARWSRSTSTGINCVTSMYLWIGHRGKCHFTSVFFYPETYDSGLIMRKTIRQTQTEGYSTKYLRNTPPNCQDHEKNNQNLRNHHNPDELKEMWQLKVTYSGWDPGTEQNIRQDLRKSE